MLQRTVQHLMGPRTEAVGAPGRLDAPPDLSKFYRANGQHTPGPEDEPEPHGAPMDASISAAPHVFGFDAGLILSLEEIQSFKTNGFLVKRGSGGFCRTPRCPLRKKLSGTFWKARRSTRCRTRSSYPRPVCRAPTARHGWTHIRVGLRRTCSARRLQPINRTLVQHGDLQFL